MEIKVIEESKDKIVLELSSEDHTFANLLRKVLWEDPNIDLAAYNIDHPLISKPKVMIKMKTGAPKDALKKAAKKIAERANEFGKLFVKAYKK